MTKNSKEDLEGKIQTFEYILPVQEFDPSKFQVYNSRMAEQGIEISTLEDEANDPECYTKLYALALELDKDIPDVDIAAMGFEKYKKMIQEYPKILPKGFFIAKKGEEYIGLCMIVKEDDCLHQSMTATRKDYRGKGIAMAMKLRTIEFAKEYGADTIKTKNDPYNIGIIKVNEKLGFKRQ